MAETVTEPTGTTEGSSDARALKLWSSLRKYWATAAGVVTVVMALTVFYTLGQKKIYEAEGTVMFDPTPPRPLGRRVEAVVDLGAGSFLGNQEYYETQYNLIQSRKVALQVVRELGLTNDDYFIQNLPPDRDPEPGSEVSPEVAADTLRSRLKVQPVRDSRLARVLCRDADPKRAQRLLSAVLDVYVSNNLETALDSTSSATDWLRTQLDTLKQDLESSELQLHQYKKANDILSLAFDAKSSMLAEQMKHINAELTRTQAELQRAAARRAVLSGVPSDDPTRIQSSELLQSPLLNTLRARYEEAVRERDALLGEKKGPNHPEVAAAQSRVDAAQKAILKEIRNIQSAVSRDVAVLSRQAGGLQGMLDRAKKQAHELGLLEIEYNRLKRSKDNTERLYSMILERTKEADLAQMMRVNNISVVDEPVLPAAPVHPRVPLNIAFGLLAGLVLGAGSVLARSMLDRTVKVPDDIEAELGIACLGLLPSEASAGSGGGTYGRRPRRRGRRTADGQPLELVVHNDPFSSMAEAARAIRTNLLFMSPDKPYQVLLVTSAGPSEGKTTVATCIAVAMAQAGQSVALIDCDLRRPRVHRIFGHGSEHGVTTAMLDDKIDDVILETGVPNMVVVGSGPIPPNPAELFHTEKFHRFVDSLRERFDRIVIDSPPVIPVTDPTVLSTVADATVLVVKAFQTKKELARHAYSSLAAVGGHVAGAVLNAVDFSRSEYKYNYYYYRRDDYRRDEAPPSDEPRGGPRDGPRSAAAAS